MEKLRILYKINEGNKKFDPSNWYYCLINRFKFSILSLILHLLHTGLEVGFCYLKQVSVVFLQNPVKKASSTSI